jgi:hypothetical protein
MRRESRQTVTTIDDRDGVVIAEIGRERHGRIVASNSGLAAVIVVGTRGNSPVNNRASPAAG